MTNCAKQPSDPDKKAAHEFLSELRTRITTQALPYQYGVEARALESLWEIFGQAREIMKKNVGCAEFARDVTQMLNVDVRPVTAKWHRAKEGGRLASRDGADEFRADLAAVQDKLRDFAAKLHRMAYGEEERDEQTPPAISAAALDRCFAPLIFEIGPGATLGQKQAQDIATSEANDINERRNVPQPANNQGAIVMPVDVVGLALSGGGIRSATFCLGVTQVLAEKRLLADVDMLSTVSGGGYTGAFLAGNLGMGKDQSELAGPNGPDTEAVRQLRLRAKFLAAANLKQAWGRVTAGLAGLLLNWTAPLLIVASTALVAHYSAELSPSPREDVLLVFKSAGVVTGLSLLAYALAMRLGDRASKFAGWLLAWLCVVTATTSATWAVVQLFDWYRVWSGGAAAIPALAGLATLGPMMMRFLPILKDPKIRALALKAILYIAAVVIPLLGLLVLYYCCELAELLPAVNSPWRHPLHYSGLQLLWAIAVVSALVSLFLLNINATSPHRLYRDGLARTFVGDDENALRKKLVEMNSSKQAPYHLINTTVNLPSSKAIALRDRRADFFLMSKYWCGSPATGYSETASLKVDGRDIGVATAIAISGAAVSPHMGLGGMPSLTALLTFLNVRLGFWIRRPGKDWRSWLGTGAPGFACLLREMTGIGMSETRRWLNLSDGGHIENLGIYELLRRRCKFIVSVDGEADPEFTFHGLMTLVRHAQIDLGVRIDARLNELRPDPATGLCKRHALLCRVYYPNGGIGLLLYLKLSVTGNESELLERYRITHPAFPHQSTLDQFFDEEQFEAYRQLGVHIAEGLFSPAVTNGNVAPGTIAAWFRCLAPNLLEP